MQTTPDHENDRISEREQSSIDPQPATAPSLEQVRDNADEPRATADFARKSRRLTRQQSRPRIRATGDGPFARRLSPVRVCVRRTSSLW
jgi:hypothetical protein